MIRRVKYVLLSAGSLMLVVLLFLQLRDHNYITIPDALSRLHIQLIELALDRCVQKLKALTLFCHEKSDGVRVKSVDRGRLSGNVSHAPSYNPVPPDEVLKTMSHKDIQILYQSYVNSPQATCSRVERMGEITDGGWELCDDPLYRPPKGDCLVYSYGINFDFSFDDDMAAYGCEVHAFDPSMNTSAHLRGDSVFFHVHGVGCKNETIYVAPKYQKWQVYTIGSHRRLLQHSPEKRRLDIVKMDVEGHELESLMTALDEGSLSDVRQIAFETHVAWGKTDPTKEQYMKFLALLRKVYERGFRIYLTHRNFMYSAFDSVLEKGKKRVFCHEIHTVNINNKNFVNADGSIVGDGMVSDNTRQERNNQQKQLLSQEQSIFQTSKPDTPVTFTLR